MVVAFLVISLITYCCFMVWAAAVAWLVCDKMLREPKTPSAVQVWRILKWPALGGIILNGLSYVVIADGIPMLGWTLQALFLGFWWAFRNIGDDDDDQKRRERTRARVKQIGGRLVVVPEVVPA